jgi:hypothetical protein
VANGGRAGAARTRELPTRKAIANPPVARPASNDPFGALK